MSIAEQFAQLMADTQVPSQNLTPNLPPLNLGSIGATRTVYSVGEAVQHRERAKHAKLGASSI